MIKKASGKPWFNQACKEKRENSTFKPRQCTVKIKLMLIEMPNIMQVGTIKKKINKQHKLYIRDFAKKLRNIKSKTIINESRGG